MGQEWGGVGTGHSSTAANRKSTIGRKRKLRRNSAVTHSKNGNTGPTSTVTEQGGQGTTYSPNAKTRRLVKPWLLEKAAQCKFMLRAHLRHFLEQP